MNKDCPLGLQFAALFMLWLGWLGVVAFENSRRWKLESEMRYYDEPFIVFPIVYAYIPVALILLGALFLLRSRRVTPMGRVTAAFRLVVWGVTLLIAVVLLTAGVWALSIPEIRFRE
jgi:amino acid transporter